MPLSYYGNIYTLHRQLFPIRCPVMEHVAMQKMYTFLFPKHNTLSIIRCSDMYSDALLKTRKLITTMEENIPSGGFDFVAKYFIWQARGPSCFVFKYFDNVGTTVPFEYYLAILRKRSPCKLNDDVLIHHFTISPTSSHPRFPPPRDASTPRILRR